MAIDPSIPPDQVLRVHPTQLYETFAALLMFAILMRINRGARQPGLAWGVFLILLGIERFLVEIVRRTTGESPAAVQPVLAAGELAAARELVRGVALAPALLRSVAELVAATQPTSAQAPAEVRRFVRYGASPRGARALALAAKARALLEGRPHVSRDDLRREAKPALRHRLILSFEAEAEGVSPDAVLDTVLPLLLEARPS